MSIPAARLNLSPNMSCAVPLPGVPRFIIPGFALASAINSFRLLASKDGWATSTCGPVLNITIGTRSFNGS